jgi:hypothetical protein
MSWSFLWGAWQAAVAGGPPPPEINAVWALSVDGVEVGTRAVKVRYEPDADTRVRVFEAWTEMTGGRRRDAYVWRQRMTATARDGTPASFHAVTETDGVPHEIQGRYGDGEWHVTVVDEDGTRTYALSPARVDLSTVDLFDPESDRRIRPGDNLRILSADIGKILEGPVVDLGASVIDLGGEALGVRGFEWRTPQGAWRLWYAENGFLVRYETPMLSRSGGPDRVVHAELTGAAPRAVDEFPVTFPGPVDALDLP